MSRFGIKGANIIESDIRAGLEGGKLGEFIMKPIGPLGKAYSVPDTIGRYVAWKWNERTFADIFPNGAPTSIRRLAATWTNDTYQNYDRLSKTAKFLSRKGIVPQFASFTMEFARNQYNQGRLINQMLGGKMGAGDVSLGAANTEAMKNEGKRRLAYLTSVYGMTFGAITALNYKNGNTPEVDAALKETVLGKWDEHRLLMASYDPKTKQGKYANPSYVIPHAVGLSALEAGINGHPISGVANMLAEEFFGEGTFVGRALYGAIAGRNPSTGKSLSPETDAVKQFLDKGKWFIKEAFEPGVSREYERFGVAVRGQGNLSKMEVIARQFGYRVNSFNVGDAKFKIGESVNNANLAKGNYNSARDYGNLSPNGLDAVYQNNNSAFVDAQKKNIRHAVNLKTLGFTDSERIQVLRDSGMSVVDVLGSLNGTTRNMPKAERITASSIWSEDVFHLGYKERDAFIRNLSKADYRMAKEVAAKDKADRIDTSNGVSSIDSLIRSLGVSDGSRAEYLFRESNKYTIPKNYIDSMIRKGVATKEVMIQLDVLTSTGGNGAY